MNNQEPQSDRELDRSMTRFKYAEVEVASIKLRSEAERPETMPRPYLILIKVLFNILNSYWDRYWLRKSNSLSSKILSSSGYK